MCSITYGKKTFSTIDPDKSGQRGQQNALSSPRGASVVSEVPDFDVLSAGLQHACPKFRPSRGHVTWVSLWDHFGGKGGTVQPVGGIASALQGFFRGGKNNRKLRLKFDLTSPVKVHRSWDHGVIFIMASPEFDKDLFLSRSENLRKHLVGQVPTLMPRRSNVGIWATLGYFDCEAFTLGERPDVRHALNALLLKTLVIDLESVELVEFSRKSLLPSQSACVWKEPLI